MLKNGDKLVFVNVKSDEKIFNPCGVYTIVFQNNTEIMGRLSSETDLNHLISRTHNNFSVKKVIVSRYINDKIVKSDLYDFVRQLKLNKLREKINEPKLT